MNNNKHTVGNDTSLHSNTVSNERLTTLEHAREQLNSRSETQSLTPKKRERNRSPNNHDNKMAKRTSDRVEEPMHHYLQTDGITMGTALAPIYANLLMDMFDTKSTAPLHYSLHTVQRELCRRKWQWIQKKNVLTLTPRMKPMYTSQIPVSSHFNTEGLNHTHMQFSVLEWWTK